MPLGRKHKPPTDDSDLDEAAHRKKKQPLTRRPKDSSSYPTEVAHCQNSLHASDLNNDSLGGVVNSIEDGLDITDLQSDQAPQSLLKSELPASYIDPST